MEKIDIKIQGMHCRSCEILIEEKLREIPQVKKAIVHYKNKNAQIFLSSHVGMEKIRQAVIDAGYNVGEEQEKNWFTRNSNDYKELVYSFLILIGLYLVFKLFGFNGFNIGAASNPSSLGIVLLVGLTAGISTCMALVGGLVLGISARHAEIHPEATPSQKFVPHLFFNLGRILSFAVLGGLIGLAGKAFQLSSPMLGVLTIIVGLVMLLLGLQLTQIFPKISNLSFTLPTFISKLFGIKKRHEKEYSHLNSALVGALTFFLPCGFTQAMQLYAISSGNFVEGALIMGIFALGTAPGLLGVGGLTSIIKGAFAQKFFKFVGLVVVFLAIFNISNGLTLAGWRFSLPTNAKSDQTVTIENGVQIIRMAQLENGYRPNKMTVQKNMPVKWIITSEYPYSCAGSLYVPDLNVQKRLDVGENVIEFTPKEAGTINFSCFMGMYGGKIIVK